MCNKIMIALMTSTKMKTDENDNNDDDDEELPLEPTALVDWMLVTRPAK